ncbi:MAG: hypothetical protein IKY02_02590, partial [Lachnospiraceae bacterium]|nr:hypothetical protein [Lachnospiraceae bacterium]
GPLACPVEEIVLKAEEVASKDGLRVLYTGDGLPVFREKIRSISKTEPLFAPEELRDPDGGAVASIGAKMLSEGKTVSAESFVPLYLRMSQAERERLEEGLSIAPAETESIEPKDRKIGE